jgi:hypothetical protein
MTSKTIAKRLSGFQLTLNNATDPQILSATMVFNYGDDKIAEGKALVKQAQQLNIIQEKEYGEQYTASNILTKAVKDFTKTTYRPHFDLARKLFPSDPGIRAAMALSGRRRRNYGEWVNQVVIFYSNALSTPEVLQKFLTLNITQEILEESLSQVDGLNLLRAAQKKESGEAQQATDDRDQALDQIRDWMAMYYTVAKIALAEKPQLLEKLGIKA